MSEGQVGGFIKQLLTLINIQAGGFPWACKDGV